MKITVEKGQRSEGLDLKKSVFHLHDPGEEADRRSHQNSLFVSG